jgi:hypothetical protein
MKKIILVAAFCGALVLVIPGTSLYADIGLGGRGEIGLDIFTIPSFFDPAYTDGGDMVIVPVIPVLDLGFYGDLALGPLHLSAGIRGVSFLFYINLFWPSLQVELDLGKYFAVNARLGGGVFYFVPLYLFTAPLFAPEISFWFTPNSRHQIRIGVGAISLVTSYEDIYSEDMLDGFRGGDSVMVLYAAVKASYNYSWVVWKRER